ncbi:TPA: hypothetical protein OUC02_004707 [Escherichia coli]|nr:hypothetical protein [Escherichia coli]
MCDLAACERHELPNGVLLGSKVINSHYDVNPNLQSDEVGFRNLASLFDAVKIHEERPPIFVDADKLQTAPEREVEAFCARVGLAHIPDSLTWQPSHLDLWRRTCCWHEGVADSSRIEFREHKYNARVENEPKLRTMYEENLPFYLYLKQACDAQPKPTFLQANL